MRRRVCRHDLGADRRAAGVAVRARVARRRHAARAGDRRAGVVAVADAATAAPVGCRATTRSTPTGHRSRRCPASTSGTASPRSATCWATSPSGSRWSAVGRRRWRSAAEGSATASTCGSSSCHPAPRAVGRRPQRRGAARPAGGPGRRARRRHAPRRARRRRLGCGVRTPPPTTWPTRWPSTGHSKVPPCRDARAERRRVALQGAVDDGLGTGWQLSVVATDARHDAAGGTDALGRPVQVDSRFATYCAVKPLVAMAAAAAVDDWDLSWDDRVGDLLVGVPRRWSAARSVRCSTTTRAPGRPDAVTVTTLPPDARLGAARRHASPSSTVGLRTARRRPGSSPAPPSPRP